MWVKNQVAYAHNWFFYFLMVSRLPGLAAYSVALFGLFLAVFRLITFNLLVATTMGVAVAVIALRKSGEVRPSSAPT